MKKILRILMVTILTLSVSMTAFAAETDGDTQRTEKEIEEEIARLMSEENMQEIEIELKEEDLRCLTREEALAVGFSEEEIEGRTIYEVKTQYNGSIPSVLYSGDVGYEDVTAYSTFNGAGHTIHANKVYYGFSIRSGNANLVIGFYSYNSNWPYSGVCYARYEDGDSYTSGWRTIYPDDTYYFKYWISTVSSDLEKELPIKFRVVMGVS